MEMNSAQSPYPYQNATIETEEVQLTRDGSLMASETGAMLECYLGFEKMAATHTGSGPSTDRHASNEAVRVQWTSVDPAGATQIDMALVNHHSCTDMSETDNNAGRPQDTARQYILSATCLQMDTWQHMAYSGGMLELMR
jgi:hypothetical protein